MTTNRVLNNEELKYISQQLRNIKKLLFWTLFMVVIIVGITAIAIYTLEKPNNFIINICFGILILLIGFLYWIFKGYKKHKINPIVYKSNGYYQRVYEQHGEQGAYYDTINGINVKMPWHWRNYLKNYKGEITYEYIVRDGAVAINERSNYYIVAVNDKLSLEYELNNGLKKVKPISFVNIVAFLLVIPTTIFMFASNNLLDVLQVRQLFETPQKNSLILHTSKELSEVKSPKYIKIEEAWVYQYKSYSDIYGDNYIISKAERDRIYNHPSSNFNYHFFVPSQYITKPNFEKFKKNILNNPLSKNTLFKSGDSAIVNHAIEKAFISQQEDYKKRVNRAKKAERILAELKPKSFILKIYDDTFNAPEERVYRIKKSLEQPHTVGGFYIPNENRLISIEEQERRKGIIKNATVLFTTYCVVIILSLLGLIKIVRNTILKKRLVKQQLLTSKNIKRLPEKP